MNVTRAKSSPLSKITCKIYKSKVFFSLFNLDFKNFSPILRFAFFTQYLKILRNNLTQKLHVILCFHILKTIRAFILHKRQYILTKLGISLALYYSDLFTFLFIKEKTQGREGEKENERGNGVS